MINIFASLFEVHDGEPNLGYRGHFLSQSVQKVGPHYENTPIQIYWIF